ncbi:hypothetical protein ACQRC6_05580 [Peptoniphilus sp. SGI.035]|uniref:hypothetical protein n=1 Tax=Peptoniphilus sp. SGI.035 TaxID=3420564 RepID=UPI003D059C9C
MKINSNGFMLDKNQEMFLKVKELENVSKHTLKNYQSLFSNIDKKINQRLDYKNEDNLCNQILTYFTAVLYSYFLKWVKIAVLHRYFFIYFF